MSIGQQCRGEICEDAFREKSRTGEASPLAPVEPADWSLEADASLPKPFFQQFRRDRADSGDLLLGPSTTAYLRAYRCIPDINRNASVYPEPVTTAAALPAWGVLMENGVGCVRKAERSVSVRAFPRENGRAKACRAPRQRLRGCVRKLPNVWLQRRVRRRPLPAGLGETAAYRVRRRGRQLLAARLAESVGCLRHSVIAGYPEIRTPR